MIKSRNLIPAFTIAKGKSKMKLKKSRDCGTRC